MANNMPKNLSVDTPKRISKAVLSGFILVFVAILIAAGAYYAFLIDESSIMMTANIIVYAASLFVGILASKGAIEKGFKNGFIAGAFFAAIYLFLTSFLGYRSIVTMLIKLALILLISTFGGIIGINLKKRR